jgi:subtilase family serine protease
MPRAALLIDRSVCHRKHKPRLALRLEELETRTLLSVYTPAQILHAYGIDQVTFNNGAIKGTGAGETIGIVDAFYDPTVRSDLASFSQRFGLAQLDGKNGDGTFTQIDLSHKTLSPAGDDWTMETALDVEWAHAVAPQANIVLVEAASDLANYFTGEPTDLLNAVNVAANQPGVAVVSMSWGFGEVPQETSWDSYFVKPGVTFVAASGDSGAGTSWPAVSPNVVSVGGTTLRLTTSNLISSETGWGNGYASWYAGGSGGGFSQYEPLPSYQDGITTRENGFALTGFGVRLNPDVAYVGNPNTGLFVLDGADGGWFQVGGTSAGAPQWAALIAIADQGRSLASQPGLNSTQTLRALYANPGDLRDITQGNTGAYSVYNSAGQVVGTIPVSAGKGYDLVTGLGAPQAALIVPALVQAGIPAGQPTALVSSTAAHAPSGHGHGSSSGSILAIVVAETQNLLPTLKTVTSANPGSSAGNLPVQPSSQVVQPAAANPIIPAAQGGGGDNAMFPTGDNADTSPDGDVPSDVAPKAAPAGAPVAPMPGQRQDDNQSQPNQKTSRKTGDAYFVEGTDVRRQDSLWVSREFTNQPTGMALEATVILALALGGYWREEARRARQDAAVSLHAARVGFGSDF